MRLYVHSNREAVAGNDQPVEVRTVDGRFVEFLRGCGGIGIVISLVQLLLAYSNEVGGITPANLIEATPVIVFFFGFPFFLLFAVTSSVFIFDVIKDRRIRFVRNSVKETSNEVCRNIFNRSKSVCWSSI